MRKKKKFFSYDAMMPETVVRRLVHNQACIAVIMGTCLSKITISMTSC